jgi:hypothetical protein
MLIKTIFIFSMHWLHEFQDWIFLFMFLTSVSDSLKEKKTSALNALFSIFLGVNWTLIFSSSTPKVSSYTPEWPKYH